MSEKSALSLAGSPSVVVVPVGSAPQIAPLQELATVEVVGPDDPELGAALSRAEGLVIWDGFDTRIERAWTTADLGDLRWIHTSSAGPDRLLFPALRAHPSVLTCSRGVLDADIAEYVLACVLGFTKDLPTTVRLQAQHRWQHRTTRSLAGSRALVVGAGSIGTRTAELFTALGVSVDGIVRSARRAAPPFEELFGPEDLLRVVGDYDHVLVAAPLSDATRGLVNEDVVAAMKPGATVVNVGRGPVVDEEALLAALQTRRLSGVALDVWATEPLPIDSPWWDTPGALVSPHLAGDSDGFTERLELVLREQVRRFVTGSDLLHVVDKEHGYAIASTVTA